MTTNLRHVLPTAFLLTLACTSPVEAPPELDAPKLDTETRLDAREGSAFNHAITITSEAPPVALALLDAPAGLTIDATGQLAWTPDFDQAGEHIVTVVATDAQPAARTTRLDLTIVVANTNRAPGMPTLTTDAAVPVFAGDTFSVTASATDPDGDALTYDWRVSDEAWSLVVDGRTVTVTATESRDASSVLTVVVSDGSATATATLALSTLPNSAPDQPVLETDTTFPVRDGEEAAFTATATDADGDTLTYEWTVSDESWSLVAMGATARVTPGERGSTAILTVTVSDGAQTASTTHELSSKANGDPIVLIEPADATLLATTSVSLSAQGSDADGDELAYSWRVEGDGWTLTDDGSTATVTAPAVVDASATVTVTVTDGWGGEVSATHALTTTGVAMRGTVDFLQSGSFTLEAPGGENVEVTANGAFAFTTTRLSPDTPWTLGFVSQPSGQRCNVAGGNGGTVGGKDVEVAVVCSIIEQRASPDYFMFSTTSKTYTSIPEIDPLSFELSRPAHALVTLSVAHAVGEKIVDAFGKVWVGVSVDGVIVEEALWQNGKFPVGGPLGFVTTVPLTVGAHTVEAVWRVGDVGESAVIEGVMGGSVTLTASVIESLPWGLGGARVSGSFEGTTAAQAPTLPLAPLTFDASATALLSAQVPDVLAEREVSFNLLKDQTMVAQGRSFLPDTAHALPLATLRSVEAGESLTLDWTSPEVATLGAAPVNLSAALFDRRVQSRTTRATDMDSIASDTFETVLTLGTAALTLPGTRRVLVFFHAYSAFPGFSEGEVELALRVDGRLKARALIKAEIVGPETPMLLADIVELNAGAHTIEVVGQRVDGLGLHLPAGLRSLTALVLD